MDIKIEGVDESIMKTALTQAREGRLHILGEMSKAIAQPRTSLSMHAPVITSITVPKDKIRDVIGSGGKVIREIIAQTGCKIDINDEGVVNVASSDGAASQKAIDWIKGLVAEVEVGKIYHGTVKKIMEFGAFVEVLPNQDGLLHVSEIAHERVKLVTDFLKEGDKLDVKVLEVDRAGKIRLSRKVLLPAPAGTPAPSGKTEKPLTPKA
jgi:polyribonucleotide nucleotidyltransferase